MPDRAKQHERSSKKRKLKDSCFPKDGYNCSFVSAHPDFCIPHQNKQRSEHLIPNGNCLKETNQTDACKVPLAPREGISSKYPVHIHLKDHVESILTELKEARQKLLSWMRQEIQAISARNNKAESASHKETGKRKHEAEYSSKTDSGGVQAALQGDVILEGKDPMLDNRQDQNYKLGMGELQGTAITHEGNADEERASNGIADEERASNGILQKDSQLVSGKHNTNIADMAITSGSGTAGKTLNGMQHGLPSNFSGNDRSGIPKEVSPDQNATSKLPVESRNALFDMCFGSGLGDDVKNVEGLDGALESSVTMRESFNKASHDMQKGLDGLERLRETKSALLDMGFDDEASNEGNGVGCSLESAASSKANSSLSKARKGVQSGFGGGNDAGFASRFAEKGKEHTPVSSPDAYRPIKVKKEFMMGMEATSISNKDPVSRSRGGRSVDKSGLVDPLISTVAPSLRGSHIAGAFPVQSSHVRDAYQQACMNARSGSGIKGQYSTAMTFKGSALESKKDVMKACHDRGSFADAYSSATSSVVLKDAVQLHAADKGQVESLAVEHGSNSVGIAGSAPAWSMFTHTSSRKSMHQTLHDADVMHLEYASRSKLGDAILGSTGATLNFQGFDPIFGCRNEMMEAYQQEQTNSSSSYFSLCTSNTDYLPASNRFMGMQRQLQTALPSSSAAFRSMLLGIPGHIEGHHEPSTMHTFLGLGMNGVPAVANGMQVLPGFYLQSNQQNTQVSFKTGPSSSSPMVTHRESSGAQEKAILELNF